MLELYAWFIDLIGMLKYRVSSGILLLQARIISSDNQAAVQDDIEEGRVPAGTPAKLPRMAVDACRQFIRRCRMFFDVSWRKCNLRFKCAYATMLLRVTMCWGTCSRIRFLYYYLAGRQQIIAFVDEKPMRFNSVSGRMVYALKGTEKIAVNEIVQMSRQRFTVKTRCRYPKYPDDGKSIAVMFKAQGGTKKSRETPLSGVDREGPCCIGCYSWT